MVGEGRVDPAGFRMPEEIEGVHRSARPTRRGVSEPSDQGVVAGFTLGAFRRPLASRHAVRHEDRRRPPGRPGRVAEDERDGSSCQRNRRNRARVVGQPVGFANSSWLPPTAIWLGSALLLSSSREGCLLWSFEYLAVRNLFALVWLRRDHVARRSWRSWCCGTSWRSCGATLSGRGYL